MNCKCSLISIQTFVPKEIFPVFCDQTKKIRVTLQQPSQSILCCILRLLTSCDMVRVGFLSRTLVLWSACEILSLASPGFYLQCNCNLPIETWKKIVEVVFSLPFPVHLCPAFPHKHLWAQEGWMLPSWTSLVPGQAQQDTLSHTSPFSTDHWSRENWEHIHLVLGPDSCLEHSLLILLLT